MTEETWDVIIVGAGLSGLSAAHILRKRNDNLRILILEGRDRVGGRTVTQEIPASPGADRFDLGGQWVGSTQIHIMDLIQELGLEVYPQYATGKKVHHIGGPRAKVRTYSTSILALSPLVLLDFTQFLWKIDRLCATVSVEDPSKTPNALQWDSMTLHSYIESHAWTGAKKDGLVLPLLCLEEAVMPPSVMCTLPRADPEGMLVTRGSLTEYQKLKEEIGVCSRVLFGMEPSQMSFLFFLMYSAAAGGLLSLLESTQGSAQEYRVKGGTQQLSERLADLVGRETVRLSTAVTAIWQDDDWAKVKTATHSFLGRAVIVTCPPHLAAKIHYQPALPAQREHLTQNMPMGHMIKFIITYQTAFWREKGFSGEIMVGPSGDCPFSVTFDATSPHGSAALAGFIAGVQASRWSTREVWERREAVVCSLVIYLGPEAAAFIHFEEKDWAKEEYSGGCPVNVMTPGMLTYYQPSLRRPCGRIHWAGSETATQWCGYMSGAVQAGQRAALEVLARLCPSTLSREELEAAKEDSEEGPDGSQQWQPEPTSFHLPWAPIIATLTMGTALLLARPQLCRDWIRQARDILQRFVLHQ